MLMNTLYKILGYAGAIPFLVCTLGLWRAAMLDPSQNSAFYEMQALLALTQIAYAGFIASFLAGMHWTQGLSQNNPVQIIMAMVPTIVALGLFLTSLIFGVFAWPLFMASIGFKLLFIIDKKYLDPDAFPDDYFHFRIVITLIVCTSLLLSAISFWI